ncbi:MAG: helix-turn-helix domain-containing protein [Proteobacteria bacterium]|nr:helix-turn-helix domain-containing protein [Pseudomonadota bacterium]
MVKSIGSITLYDVEDIAKALEMNPRIIRSWFTTGKLKGKKVGKNWMITEEDLREFFSNKDKGGERVTPKTKRKTEET